MTTRPTTSDVRRMNNALVTPLMTVRGVGVKVAAKLTNKGLRTLGDALGFLPLRYDDRTSPVRIGELVGVQSVTLTGELTGYAMKGHGRRSTLEASVVDDTGFIKLKWFRGNFDWIRNRFKPGDRVRVSGVVKPFRGVNEIHHPEMEVDEEGGELETAERVIPIYSEVDGVHPRALRRIMAEAVNRGCDALVDVVPAEIIEEMDLVPLGEAFRNVHLPPAGGEALSRVVARSRRSIVFEEFFFLQLGLLLKRSGAEAAGGLSLKPTYEIIKPFLSALEFELTAAQRRVLGEIRVDMESPHPMHRLLQGDVGSGKTLVALLTMLMAVETGHQAAMMAPTEILAEQHYATLRAQLAELPVTVDLLTGSVTGSEREEVLCRLRAGETDIIVGTHALIQEGVEFASLAMAVVDEQHRFGVLQRSTLSAKGRMVDLLVMTATPIPRSLSLTVYGDLDVSVIDELPPGRTPIVTRVGREKDREPAYAFVRNQCGLGRQAYIVYPLVEESEKLELKDATSMAARFDKETFPDLTVGLLHGRMKGEEKDAVMSRFAAGLIQVLVCTTVVEVGIDVPNATVMVVEHAERFGLSQLHQLRGRVGRGAHKSYCLLLAGYQLSREGFQRLSIMGETADGFRIAEEDLLIRGPGDFLGTRQSGLPNFKVGSILRDGRILQEAREAASRVIDADPELSSDDNRVLRNVLFERWADKLTLVSSG